VGFDLKSEGVETRGRAHSVGTIQLQERVFKKKKMGLMQRAVIRGWLNDICPEDGFGAYLELRAYYHDPDATLAYSSKRKYDTRGCHADRKNVVIRTGWVKDPYKIEIQLYEYDAETGDIAFEDEQEIEYSPGQLGG
jgi:hypothetical protein